MSERGYYKKLVDKWLDDDKSQQRARENQFFGKDGGDKVGAKSKSKAKPNSRADHKHDYAPVVIWRYFSWRDEMIGSVGERCSICGKRKQDYSFFHRNNELKKYYGELDHFQAEENDKLIPIEKEKYQKTIFLGGSQTLNELTVEVKNELVDDMNLGHKFLIGDCKGADCLMQKFLSENGYKNVTVYYSGERSRMNLGGWEEKKIGANKYDSGYEIYKRKDEQMAKDACEGFMILKGATRGTMANVERLLALKKNCLVVYPEREKANRKNNSSVYDVQRIKSPKDFDRLQKRLQEEKNG